MKIARKSLPEDYPRLAELIESKTEIALTPNTPERIKSLCSLVKDRLDNPSDLTPVISILEDNKIIGVGANRLATNLNYWLNSLLIFETTSGSLNTNYSNNGFVEFMNASFEHAEKMKYFSFIAIVPVRSYKITKRIFSRYAERYDYKVSYYYAAGDEPKFEVHRQINGMNPGDVFPIDMIVQETSLKNEFREQLLGIPSR